MIIGKYWKNISKSTNFNLKKYLCILGGHEIGNYNMKVKKKNNMKYLFEVKAFRFVKYIKHSNHRGDINY